MTRLIEVAFEGVARRDSLGRRLRVAIEKKMLVLTDQLYDKVIENLSGKILQKQTGQLVSSVHKHVDATEELIVGSVFIAPVTDKAWVLEHGGKGQYLITPTKAAVLRWWTKGGEKVFAMRVSHPPSKAFRYMAEALDEMRELIPLGFRETIQAVVDGGDFG